MANEKFCLRWNDFESNISVAFREIREEKDFFDCTLSCGARQIQAHKLILSACSPFFRTILKQNQHQHPLLYLKGVGFTDLQAVLNFMYHGEVNVAQEELNSFLAVAEELQVKGLTQSNSAPAPSLPPPSPSAATQERKPKVPRPQMAAPVPAPGPPRPRHQTLYQEQRQEEDIQEIVPLVKTEPDQVSYTKPSEPAAAASYGQAGTEVANMQENYEEEGFDYGYEEGYEEQGQYQGEGVGGADADKDVVSLYAVKTDNGKVSCTLCGYVTRDKYNIRMHLEGRHGMSNGYQCDKCSKQLRTKQSLTQHRLHCAGPSF